MNWQTRKSVSDFSAVVLSDLETLTNGWIV